jgi:DNA invertase Pin-like site-specific DNA recombinase
MTALLGYARVSTDLQNPALQTDALAAAGCDRVWVDHASGTRADRPQLAALLDWARPGDTLAVWRLDRLGRSVPHLVRLMSDLDRRGVQFRSLTEAIDTTTPGGKLVFTVFAAVAQFEADLVRDRTRAGLEAARARGRVGGRPRALNGRQRDTIDELVARGASITHAAQAVGTSRATVYRHLESKVRREETP